MDALGDERYFDVGMGLCCTGSLAVVAVVIAIVVAAAVAAVAAPAAAKTVAATAGPGSPCSLFKPHTLSLSTVRAIRRGLIFQQDPVS